MAVAEPRAPERPALTIRPMPGGRRLWISIAALLALYLVAHLLLLSRFPWFIDEALFSGYARTAEGDRAQRFAALVDHKGLLNSWIGAVLIHFGVSPLVAMRLISVAAGVVAAAATGVVVRIWRGTGDAVIAAGLTLFVPYLFVHDSVAVYDAFIAAGSMVALALQLWLARTRRLDAALLLGITWGMLMLSKPTGALAILMMPFSLAVFDWSAERRWRRLSHWAGLAVLALVIAVAMFALTKLSPLSYQPGPDNHRSFSDLIHHPFGELHSIAKPAFQAILGYITWPLLLVSLWGIWVAVRTRDRVGLVLTVWALAALVSYLLLTTYAFPRYGLQIAAPLCALAVLGGRDLFRIVKARWSRTPALVITLVALLPMLVLDARVLITPETAHYPGLDDLQFVTAISNRQPVREASQIIVKRAPAFTAATPARDRTVALSGYWTDAADLVLNGNHLATPPRFTVLPFSTATDDVNAARWIVVDEPAPPGLDLPPGDLVRTWKRPHGGATTRLYDRGPSTTADTP